jgi:putative membrane protein
MKRPVGLFFSVCVWAFVSCNNFSPGKHSKADSLAIINADASSLEALSPAPVSPEDSAWLTTVAAANAAAIKWSELAQQKATSGRLKNFAGMLVSDHIKTGEKLQQLAFIKQLVFTEEMDSAGQKEWDHLNKKSGKDFDEAYMETLLRADAAAATAFSDGSTNLQDPDLKNFADLMLPVIQAHQDSMNNILGKK